MANLFKRNKDAHSLDPSGVIRSVRTREHRRFAWLRRKWVIVVLAVVVVLGGIAGYALWLYTDFTDDIQVPDTGTTPPKDKAKPFNALLVGSDSRAGLSKEEQDRLGAGTVDPATGEPITGERADTLIVAHIDPSANHVTMVQFPRDYYVRYAGGHNGKINSALDVGRRELVLTVQQLTGITINRYVQVNIAGFRDLVEAVGGVDVCIPEPIPFDKATGIEVTPEQVGMVHFGGDRAISFVRSRKVFGDGDLARIQNQQKFLAAAVEKITRPGTFLNLAKILDLKNIAGKNLRIDDHTSPVDLLHLLQRFKAFNPNNYEAYTAPDAGFADNEAGSVILPDYPALEAMFGAIEANESPAEAGNAPHVRPSDISVGVYNGTGGERVASRAARALVEATTINGREIQIEEEANAARFGYRRTVIRYEKAAERKARFVAAAIPGARLKRTSTKLGIDVEVIVGRGFKTTRIIRITPIPIPEPGDLPTVCRP